MKFQLQISPRNSGISQRGDAKNAETRKVDPAFQKYFATGRNSFVYLRDSAFSASLRFSGLELS
jgi:hypothetical protein